MSLEKHGFGTLPLYVRENSVLALGGVKEVGDACDYARDVEVCQYEAKEGAKTTLVDHKGNEIGVLQVGSDRGETGPDPGLT
jgi:alpha-D-xyloside xylohydrolase